MSLILWTTISILLYSAYMVKKIYVDKPMLYGIDISMSEYWNKSYIPILFEFKKAVPDLELLLLKNVDKWTSNSDSMLFLETDQKSYSYNKHKFNINKFLYKKEKLDIYEMNELAIQSQLSAIICYTDTAFCFCFNHTFFDGYSSFNFLKELFDNGLTDCVHKYNYFPFFTEIQCIPSIKNLSKLYKNRNLDYSPPFQDSIEIKTDFFKRRYDIDFFKNIKKKFLVNNIKLNFNAIVSAYVIYNLFNILPSHINKLNIGIIAALNTDIGAFNNYGLIVLTLHRGDYSDLNSLIIYLNNYYKKNYHLVITSYLLNNIFKKSGEFELDLLMSGGPIVLNKQLSINNIAIKNINCYNPYNTMPIYCSYISCDKFVHTTFSIKSKDIDIVNFKKSLIAE